MKIAWKIECSSFAAFFVFSFVNFAAQATENRPHLALLSTSEIHQLLESRTVSLAATPSDQDEVLHAGQRVYDWINVLNQNRPGQKPLSYSDPSNMSNPTMDHPKIYDAETGKLLYADILKDMPQAYRDVVTGQDPLPTQMPIPEDQFLALGFRVTGAYDIAARWLLMQDWLADLQADKVHDMRGYVALTNLTDRDLKLQNFGAQLTTDQAQLREWLTELCLNTQLPSRLNVGACTSALQTAEKKSKLVQYYQTYLNGAKQTYADFFTLDPFSVRTDISWNSKDPQTLHYPFLEIADQSVAAYLKDNVEDEWRGQGWHLNIDFTNKTRYDLSHLEYQPNTTPHEDTNKIVMDENEPRTEYLSQWTIRHEFGHLLGFKDCYVEFYDDGLKKIVNYPLDPTNLMCSRRGHLQQQHADILKARYFKP